MVRTIATAQPGGRKRRRNERDPEATCLIGNSQPSSTFPRISSAPPRSSSTPAFFHSASHGGSQANVIKAIPSSPLQRNAPVSDADLEAMITTLSLIYKHGYGSEPGKPSIRCRTAGSCRRGRRGNAIVESCFSSRGSALKGRGTSSGNRTNKDSRGGSSSRSPCRPWTAPSSSVTELRPPLECKESKEESVSEAVLVPSAIAREDFKRSKARKEASRSARTLLLQLGPTIRREDFVSAAQLLKSAREKFHAAGNRNGVVEVDVSMTKIKADLVVKAIKAAREAREYDRMQELMFEAQHYFAILARLGRIQRHDALCKSERREADRRTYEGFLHPHRLCRNNALEDGRSSWRAALRLARKRKYAAARSRLVDARRCFQWAGRAEKEIKELERIEEELEFRENSAQRDHLIESMTHKVQFLSPKDYGELFAKLSEAATAYGIVRDDKGAQAVSAVTAGLKAVRSAEESWLALMEALKERRYPSASQHLRDATRSVLDATRGLPEVSSSLARAAEILSPAGGLSHLDIIAELAVLDGLRDHEESIRLLNEGLLDKAQERNTSAREVLEFTARSCCELSVDDVSDNGEMVDRGQVEAGEVDECDSKRVMEPTSSEHGSLRLSFSKGGGCPAADEGAAQEQQVIPTGERNTPREATWIDQPFVLSDEQLREGEALLLRILQLTPASTEDDGSAFEPRWSTASTNSSVRDRVEDILDDIFVNRDIITCHKELERGDKLMSLFWEIVAASGARASPEKSKSVSCDESDHGSRKSNEDAITSAGTPDNVQFREEVSGVLGDKLSTEAAEECLRLLVEATEAYEGQGFETQAGHAIRLRAGIVADRCLARAIVLAQTNKAIVGDESRDEATKPEDVGRPTTSSIATAAHLGLTSRGYHGFRSIEAFEAARAAACEAESNYASAGNTEGALRARRILMSLKGDEAMVDAVSLLQQRMYIEALQAMCRASGFYIDAGPEGEEDLCRVRDPGRLVEAIALEDGLRLKGEAVRLLRDGDVETATYIRGQAQRCFSFVDCKGLADATVDVETAAHMVTRLADGDAAAADAEEALECGEIGIAIALFREAKSLYRKAQLCYEELVDKVTGLIKAWPNDHEASLKAIELQDNINTIYDSRVDGKRVARVESCLDCLAADESLEGLAQVLDCELFEDARTLLSSSAKVYERSADRLHISKVKRIISLVGMVEKAIQALNIGHYEEAEQIILESLRVRSALTSKRPISLRPPDCKLLQGGESGVKAFLWARVRKAGESDSLNAFKLMEREDYNAAKVATASASSRFEWCARHVDYASPEDAEGASDVCVAALREVEELKAKMSEASGRVKTERTVQEGTTKMAQEDLKAAVNALRAAAGLFRSAGLGDRSTIAKAETKLTQGEAWMVTAEALHDSGDPEASIEHLRRARTLLLKAAEIADTTAPEPLIDLVHPTTSGNDDTTNVSTTTGLKNLPEKSEFFQSRIAGHITIPGVLRAQDALDYYKALCLMIAAEKYYDTVIMEEWWTSAGTVYEGGSAVAIAAPVMTGAPVEFERTSAGIAETSTPPEQGSSNADGVVVVHQHPWSERHGSAFNIGTEGIVERVKGDTASGRLETEKIVPEGTTKKAQVDFQQAVNILRAATGLFRSARLGERSATAKVKMKRRKMFKCFQLCRAGDDICRRLANLLQEKQMDRAKEDLAQALDMYRQGEAFEKFADTQAVASCVERENALCCDFVSTVVTGDPATAEKVLEESRPLFKKTAEIKSEVLQDVVVIIAAKHRHIKTLSAFCRVWAKHLSSLTPATTATEDDPNPACTLDAILSSIRCLSTSEADMLNVSLEVLGCACTGVVDTPTPSEPETSDPDGVSNSYQSPSSGRHGSSYSMDAEGIIRRVKGDKASSEMEAEGTIQEGETQKAQGGFKEALNDLRAAAELFQSAGLGERSATAKAKVKLTQADAWMITAEALHDSGDLEASAEHLRRGGILLLEAAEIGDATATGKSVDFVHPTNSGDVRTINVSAATRLENLLEKYKCFQSPLTGDITIRGVQPVLDFLDYYKALCLMLEAKEHYATVKIENRLTSAETTDHSLAAEPTVEQFDHKSTVDTTTTVVSTKAEEFENNTVIAKTEEGLEQTRNIDSTVDNAEFGTIGPAFEGEDPQLALTTSSSDSKPTDKGCEAVASKEEEGDAESNSVDYDFEVDNGVVSRTGSNTPMGVNGVMVQKCGDYYDTTAVEQPADLVSPTNSSDVGTINVSAKTRLENLLVKSKLCQSRLAGVITVREVLLALRALDYYEALRLMLEVERHYDTAKMEEWLAPALKAHGEEGVGTTAGPVLDEAAVELDCTYAGVADTSTLPENRVTASKIGEGFARACNDVATGDTAEFGTSGPALKGTDDRLSPTTPVGDIESVGHGYEAGESIVSALSGPSELSIASKITRGNGPKQTPMENDPGRPEQGDTSSYDLYDDFLVDNGVVSRTASIAPACENTVRLMERRGYKAAEVVAAPPSTRFEWCASHAYYASPDTTEGTTGVRTAVLRKVEDRKVEMSKAPLEMEAEETVQKQGTQKAQGDFQEALNTLRTVAGLFPSVELGERTATAKAKAKVTQAEAWMITAEALHDSGDLEASAEHLLKGRTLLLEAAEIGDATAAEKPADLVYSTKRGKAGTINASAKKRLDKLLLKNKFCQSRLAGDITVRGVLPALRALDYYEALRLMLKAERYYAAVKMETRLAPAVMAYGEEGAGTTAGPVLDGAAVELDVTCAGVADTSTLPENRVTASKIGEGLAQVRNDVTTGDTAGFGTGRPALKGTDDRLSPTIPVGDIESAGHGYEAGESIVSTLSGPNESYLVSNITRENGPKRHSIKHDLGRPEQGDAGSYNLEDDFEDDSGVVSRTASITFITKTSSTSDTYSSDWQRGSEFGGVEGSGTPFTKNLSQLQRNHGYERYSPWDISKPADDGSQSITGNTRSSSGLGSGGREETQMDSLDGTNYYSSSNSYRRSHYDSDRDSIDYASAGGQTRDERGSQHLPFTLPGTPRGARVRWNLEAKRRPSYTMNTN